MDDSSQTTFLDAQTMRADFQEMEKLGQGTDGIVTKYSHRRIPGRDVAVKMPRHGTAKQKTELLFEIRHAKKLIKCPEIIEMLGWDMDWLPFGPAIFYEYCELGDLHDYRDMLCEEDTAVPEETIWKLFMDGAKAIDYMHNHLDVPLVHGDIKDCNILVSRPQGCMDDIPILPNFKIGDFSRSVEYTPGHGPVSIFNGRGTPEFGPPEEERKIQITPAADIWCLGSTLQYFVFGRMPIQSREKFVETLMAKGKAVPASDELGQRKWRHRIPVVYRPLNATPADQIDKWDVKPDYTAPQYSTPLNTWYTMCMERDMRKRIPAEDLVKWLVPLAKRQIDVLSAKRKAKETQEFARRHTTNAINGRVGAARPTHMSPQVVINPPNRIARWG